MASETTRGDLGERLASVDVNRWPARIVGIVLFFVGWFAVASVFPNELMPYPVETLQVVYDLFRSGKVLPEVTATLTRIFWGFLASMLLGIQMGVFMGLDDYQRKFLTPHIVIGLSAPLIAWSVIATLIFGFSIYAPILATILTAAPFIAITVWKGVEDIDTDLLEMSNSFGISRRRTIFKVVLPSVAPELFTAFRFGLSLSWKIVTITEIFASNSGIGYQIIRAYGFVRFDEAWAWAVIFMGIVLILEYGVIKPVQWRVLRYRPDTEISLVGR
jgi:ABC-type nitrate/sulfonate/bicarbonate transport system permease component